tara:strand:- start:1027 stop:1371 length:345 start_codon:yes stop_codon:yes gene_type:complete
MTISETAADGLDQITLAGDADLGAVPMFQAAMRKKVKGGTKHLVVDFSEVTFVNTPIWAVIVEYYQSTIKSGHSFAISGLKGRVEASFNIVRLGEFIQHFESVAEARENLLKEP